MPSNTNYICLKIVRSGFMKHAVTVSKQFDIFEVARLFRTTKHLMKLVKLLTIILHCT